MTRKFPLLANAHQYTSLREGAHLLRRYAQPEREALTGHSDGEVARGALGRLRLSALPEPRLQPENKGGPSHKSVTRQHCGHWKRGADAGGQVDVLSRRGRLIGDNCGCEWVSSLWHRIFKQGSWGLRTY